MRYQIKHAIVKYAADTILEDVNFEIRDNEKIAIVGRNGCGKTTLLKLMAGDITMSNLDSDEECGIVMAGTQRIGYLRQMSFDDQTLLVEEEIRKVFEPIFEAERKIEEYTAKMEQFTGSEEDNYSNRIMREYAGEQAAFESLGGYTYQKDMETVFQRFGFALEDLKRPLNTFSGGQQTKIAFVKLLLSRPDIMLLDEPTNHLDLPTIEWLEGYLKNYSQAVVIVSHDRMFLDHVTDVTYEIEYHLIKRYPGNYSAFLERKRLDTEKQEKDYEEQQKEIARLTAWIEKWKNTPTKVASTRSKRMVIEHMVKIEKPRRYDLKSFHAQFAPRIESHKEVLKVNKLQIGYDNILSTLTFQLLKGQKIAIIGENGKGKSTLLKTLIGEIPALGGSFQFGTDVEYGYFDQQAALADREDPCITVLDDFWNEYPTLMQGEVRQALGNFLFSQDDVYKQLGQLSGGEKVRLALCKLFKRQPNFLILDEPTNHMDIVGKQALEWMLKNFTGSVLYVSHDRYFIKETATAILEFGTDHVTYYPCGYEEYLELTRAAGETEGKPAQTGRQKQGTDKLENAIVQKGSVARTSKPAPSLEDVWDKKTYYNPGKIEARRKQQIAKYEKQLEESEQHLLEYQMQLMDPAISSDYERLTELQEKIDAAEHEQDNLLNWLAELESEGVAEE